MNTTRYCSQPSLKGSTDKQRHGNYYLESEWAQILLCEVIWLCTSGVPYTPAWPCCLCRNSKQKPFGQILHTDRLPTLQPTVY